MPDIKISIATPAFGEMFYTPYVQSLLRLQRLADQRKWTIRHMAISYAYVGEARNSLLTHWYDKTDSTHLLFVDADMGFDARLIEDMLALGKPVVGVIYTKRQVDLNRLVEAAAKGERPQRAIARAHDFIIRPLRGRQPRRMKGFMEVAGCGTGIMLIQRSAIATMLKMLPEINDTRAKRTTALAAGLDRMIRAFDTLFVDGVPLLDDFAFCHRWNVLCKGEIWARTDQAVTHIGLHKFGARYSDVGIGMARITLPGKPAGKLAGKPARKGGNGKTGPAAPKVITGKIQVPKGKPAGK
jgi:hypothetical protein